jgi:hypothetical protein
MKKKSTPRFGESRFGELPPRYKFYLNPYSEVSLHELPHLRKADEVAQVPADDSHCPNDAHRLDHALPLLP